MAENNRKSRDEIGYPQVDANSQNEGDRSSVNNDDINEILREMNPDNNNCNAAKNETCHSNSKSIDNEDNRCHEVLPSSSESNKENVYTNLEKMNEFNPEDYVVVGEHSYGDYDRADLIPLPDLLKIHPTTLISGFEFGEETKRRAQENMLTARNKTLEEKRKSVECALASEDTEFDEDQQPCCSKTFSEQDHKTPHSYKRQRLGENRALISNSDDFPRTTRGIPECLLDNPDCIEIWIYMIYKEEAALKLRNSRLFYDFKGVTPRMRAILLDWLMEVSEVYRLRRVTYYLSVDYFDRFLSIRPDIPKSLLQLVGITCLYIAAKVEEIYPPNLSEFSYVCDGACKSKEMVSCELLILNSLGWEVILTTPSDWLNLYMQLHFKSKDIVRTNLNLDFNKDFAFPQYSAYQFTRASQLMDLISLDPGFLNFTYSTIAATAMFFLYGREIALAVSGLRWDQMEGCADYMEVFYNVIQDAPDPRLRSCLGESHSEETNRAANAAPAQKSGQRNENYSYQTHVVNMEYFEKATMYRLAKLARECESSDQEDSSLDNVNNNEISQESIPSIPSTSASVEQNNTLEELGLDNESNLFTPDSNSSNPSSECTVIGLNEIYELVFSQDEDVLEAVTGCT